MFVDSTDSIVEAPLCHPLMDTGPFRMPLPIPGRPPLAGGLRLLPKPPHAIAASASAAISRQRRNFHERRRMAALLRHGKPTKAGFAGERRSTGLLADETQLRYTTCP